MKKIVKEILPIIIIFFGVNFNTQGKTIDFNGRVDNRLNCMAFFGNSSSQDGLVTLPAVSVNSLNSPGKTAADTTFQIQLLCDCSAVQCNGPSAYPSVRIFFENGPTIDPSSGMLNNTTSVKDGGAANVKIQLLDASNNLVPVQAGNYQNTKNVQREIPSPRDPRFGTAGLRYTFPYVARYYAADVVSAGIVTSVITYVIDYS